jgi:hypothetical protein
VFSPSCEGCTSRTDEKIRVTRRRSSFLSDTTEKLSTGLPITDSLGHAPLSRSGSIRTIQDLLVVIMKILNKRREPGSGLMSAPDRSQSKVGEAITEILRIQWVVVARLSPCSDWQGKNFSVVGYDRTELGHEFFGFTSGVIVPAVQEARVN